jgi:hypothetical protein
MLKLSRNKKFITALAALALCFLAAHPAQAKGHQPSPHISYRAQLGGDLDGDHIPEIASVRYCGDIYQVNIHFTTGRPKLRLLTHLTESLAGLTFETRDVDNDNKRDLVLVSATSRQPIGVWLNQGGAKFRKVNSSLYAGVGRNTGPTYRYRGTSEPEPVGNISVDPLPQLVPAVENFGLNHDSAVLLSSQLERRPVECILGQVSPRAPPVATHF